MDLALLIARRHAYHPVRNYLNYLQKPLPDNQWSIISSCCFGTTDEMSNLHLQRQLIALVARAMQPGCKVDTSLILHSDRQGIGKSTFWSILGGEWFSDSLGDLRNVKDDILQLHSAWIHEWGEIDRVMGKRDSESLKRFLSASNDDVRKPYGRAVERLQRSCGIVGTTNRRDFITDFTGNRRFPIISIDEVALDWVKDNRDAIWASALNAYKSGIVWHYNQEENDLMNQEAHKFRAIDPLLEQLETWLEENQQLDEIPVAYALEALGYVDEKRDVPTCRKMARHFRSLGWNPTPTRQRYSLPTGGKTDKTTGWCRPMPRASTTNAQ